MTGSHPVALADLAAGIPLDRGDLLAPAIAEDGSVSVWIVRPITAALEADLLHGNLANAGHEMVGPLPPAMRIRMAHLAVPRCGGRRMDGGVCRTLVAHLGSRCHHHRASEVKQ